MAQIVNTVPGGDLYLDAAAGNVEGASTVQKFGRNQDVDSAANEDIWDGGGIWVAPTQARIHDIASTDDNDGKTGAPSSTGARTLRLWGLTDWDTAEVSEDITLDGTTNVATSNSYVIIHRMQVLTKGGTDVNIGTITATAQTDGTVTAQIDPGFGATQMAIYGVPSTQTAYVWRFYTNILKTTGATSVVDAHLLFNPEPDSELTNFITMHTFVNSDTTGNTQIKLDTPKIFAGPCIIKLQADASANDTDVGGGFDLILVDN